MNRHTNFHAIRTGLTAPRQPLSITRRIIAFENDELDECQTIHFFQELLNNGMITALGEKYQMKLAELLGAGKIRPTIRRK